jgi:hypothetical protein
MKISISGHGGSGKGLVAAWFNQHTALRYTGGTSWYGRHYVFEQWGHLFYDSPEDCFAARALHRERWASLLDDYNKDDLTRLYRLTLENQDILDGVRRRDEFKACLDAGMVDLAIWLKRDVPTDTTLRYGPELCDVIIENNGCVEDIHRRLKRFTRALGVFTA